MTTLHLALTHRAVLVRDGRAVRALAPGRYVLWRHHEVIDFDTTKLVFDAPAAIVAALPHDWYEVVHVAPAHYGVVTRDERAVAFLQPGIHRIWKVEANVHVRVFAETDPLPELTKELRGVIPAGELLDVTVELNQRAVLLRDGKPERVLAPGHHAFWGKQTKLTTWNVDELVLAAQPAVLAMLPRDWFRTLHLEAHQRAVVFRDDKPVKFLRPGLHRVWTVDPTVDVRTYAVTDPAPELTDELRAVIPATELVEVQVKQFERGLKYVQGKFEGVLEPGKHAFWTHANARVTAQVLDTRVQQLKVEGQELMTRDKVTLRLTLTAEYAPTDAATTVHAVADVKDALYLAVQLAAREFVAGVTLDELLEGRDALDALPRGAGRAACRDVRCARASRRREGRDPAGRDEGAAQQGDRGREGRGRERDPPP